jgi:hypothetical protein
MQLNITIGIFLANLLGASFHWINLLRMSLIPGVAAIALVALYAPETPAFLVSLKRDRQACMFLCNALLY